MRERGKSQRAKALALALSGNVFAGKNSNRKRQWRNMSMLVIVVGNFLMEKAGLWSKSARKVK